MTANRQKLDRTNAILAVFVFLASFIAYALTVQRSFSFWDSGEFVAAAYLLGIPHPPGFPLYVILGHLSSIIPFVSDIAYRINYVSVVSSAFTAMFSYILTVKLVGYFFKEDTPTNRYISYLGGLAGGFFVAFSMTNWANSVEAEVYGLSLALMVLIAWLTVKYFEARGTRRAAQLAVLISYIAMLGVGIHLTVYLIVPFAAIFLVLKPEAQARDYMILSGFILAELLLIVMFSDGRGGVGAFYGVTVLLAIGLFLYMYKRIDWPMAIAIGSISSIMVGFGDFMKIAPIGLVVLMALAMYAKSSKRRVPWQTAMGVMLAGLMGFSVQFFSPVRSSVGPKIDMNDPSRDFRQFQSFLDRKQYGNVSMVDRMFERRGTWSNQFGRHAHMGFWSYFEEQYSSGGWGFLPFFALGVLGMVVAILKRKELGLPFMTLFLICSAGLILYMNFADGTLYNAQTGDAYMEVRERDYFFTPAFVFFGIAMGMGISGLIALVKERVSQMNPSTVKTAVAALSVLVLLPVITLARNYHPNDRSNNYLPYTFGANILMSCDSNAVLFTTGDNETYPLWSLQHVEKYRTDVSAVNLSLLNMDWYVEQMKNMYHVPMSLSDDQILRYPMTVGNGQEIERPKEMFVDRPRGLRTYLVPYPYQGGYVTVANMVVDDAVIENQWRRPMFFSSLPYAESPLKLRDRATTVGLTYSLERQPPPSLVDVDKSYDLFMNKYTYRSLGDPSVYRYAGISRDFQMTIGTGIIRLYNGLVNEGDSARAVSLLEKMVQVYPQFWQSYYLLEDHYDKRGDTAKADALIEHYRDTVSVFVEMNEGNPVLVSDLGMAEYELGRRKHDAALVDEGIAKMWDGFLANPNDLLVFRKLASVLAEANRRSELRRAGDIASQYKRNQSDPLVRSAMSIR